MKNLNKKILLDAVTSFEQVTEMKLSPFVTQDYIELELRDNEFPILLVPWLFQYLAKQSLAY